MLFNPADIKTSWTVVESPYSNGREARCLFTLTNNGTTPLPAKGWKIYFNSLSVRNLDAANAAITVERINGDIFNLYAGKTFKTLNKGDSASTQIIISKLNNQTDFPKGFYIVFDSAPAKGIPLAIQTSSTVDYVPVNKQIAEKAYQQNKLLTNIPSADLPPVFPTPLSYKKTAGSFGLSRSVKIVKNAAFSAEAEYLAGELHKILGFSPAMSLTENTNMIVLHKKAILAPGAYELLITPAKITISAADNAGIFYGIQSLKTLLPPNSWAAVQNFIVVPCVSITDAPRFGYRAFMMDVARNFQKKAEVLKVIDLISLYKFNVFHFHLTDDEGWRLQIPGLPELTQVGGTRGHSVDERDHILPSYGSGPDTINAAGSGYFTRKDYIEILKYANARHIKVIPEIESPGHARAAIKAMDSRYYRLLNAGDKAGAEQYLLRDVNDKSKYRSVQGFSDNVINAALPSAYTFLTKVTDEIIAMYKEAGAPLETIHFGGDEVPAGVWEQSPAVTKLLKQDTSVKSVDDLWYYYYGKINTMLKSRKLYLTGWEEIGLRKAMVGTRKRMVLDTRPAGENYHADVWNNLAGNEDLAYKLANAGYKVILTNVTNFYLDLAYNNSNEERGQYWGGFVDLNKPFDFIPYNYYKNQKEDETGKPLPPGHFAGKEVLTDSGRVNIIGIQSPLWSEVITSAEKFEYLLLPKLLGVAERAWAADPQWATEPDSAKSVTLYNTAWNTFVNKVSKTELPRLDHYAGGFSYRIPTAGIQAVNNMVDANVQLPGFTLRYTTDGTEPTAKSKIFNGAIPDAGTLSFRVFNANGRGGRTVKFVK